MAELPEMRTTSHEVRSLSRMTRWPLILGFSSMGLFLSTFIGWSVAVPLSEAAIAGGMVKVEGTRRSVQHLEGGMVREILVRDGDRVEAGQILLRLDDVQAVASREALQSELWNLLAQDARLRAELDRSSEIVFPIELEGSRQRRAVDAMSVQQSVFLARRANAHSQVQVLRSRIDQQRAVILAIVQQIRSLQAQKELLEEEERAVATLVRQGLERTPRLLGIRRSLASADGNLGDYRAQLERAQAAIEEAEGQIRQIDDARIQEAAIEMRDVRSRIADIDERLRAAQDVAARREVLAPEAGIVLHSRVFTIGAVLRPGDLILELVPHQDRLIAEVEVQPNDIDAVRPGLRSELRFPGVKQRLAPVVHGVVTLVAPDVTSDARTGRAFYRVQISLDEENRPHANSLTLQPGMPVEAMIVTGQRSFARYVFQPMLDSFHRAFREQ